MPLPQRRSIRLPHYNYSQSGIYFLTICTHNRALLLGQVIDETMQMNAMGEAVFETWQGLTSHYTHIQLHEFVVMPNHIHGIVQIDAQGTSHGLSEVVRGLKTFSARKINQLRGVSGVAVWQRNYYEHVIRDEQGYFKISEYIQTNPVRWQENKYFCQG